VSAWAIAALVRLLAWSWRVRRDPWPVEGACVLAIWHGDQLPMIALHRGMGIVALASRSKDGALVSAVLERLGYGVIRGSSSRGGAAALLAARRAVERGQRPVFTVDGPRGPRGTIQPGAAALAASTGVPLVWGAVEAPGWRARSWDRFLVPWPFARVRVTYRVEAPTRT
jgi:lysophospholipid acyltransferase (LPLAT)-like uncharacterized protein